MGGIARIAARRMLVGVLHHLALDDEIAQRLEQALVHLDAEHLRRHGERAVRLTSGEIHHAVGDWRQRGDLGDAGGDAAQVSFGIDEEIGQSLVLAEQPEERVHIAARVDIQDRRPADRGRVVARPGPA